MANRENLSEHQVNGLTSSKFGGLRQKWRIYVNLLQSKKNQYVLN